MATIEINKTGGDPPYSTIAGAIAVSDVSSSSCILEITDNSEYDEQFTLAPNTGSTTETNYLELRAASANRHSGVFGTSGHARITTTSTGDICTIGDDNCRVKYLQFWLQSPSGSSQECIDWGGGRDRIVVSYCIFRGGARTDQDGIYTSADTGGAGGTYRIYVDNCVFQDLKRAGVHMQLHQTTVTAATVWECYVDHCTFYNMADQASEDDGGGVSLLAADAQSTVNANVYNCAVHTSATGTSICYNDKSGSGAFNWAGTDNIANDTSCETLFGAANSFDSVTFIATDPVSGENMHVTSVTSTYDFTIVDEDTETVTQNGVDRVGSEPYTTAGAQDFANDIAGNDRGGESTISIGAFEFITAAGGTTPRFLTLTGVG